MPVLDQSRDPSTDPEMLKLLSKNEDEDVRANVGANTSTPVDTLRRLSHDRISDVRMAVAANTKTPIDAVRRLLSDRDMYVRDEAKYNLDSRGCKTPPC